MSTLIGLNYKHGQTIFDIALMTYGSLDYVYKIIQDNQLNNINDPIPANKILIFDKDLVLDITVYNTIQNRALIYSTNESFDIVIPPTPSRVYDNTYDLTYN